MPTMTVPSATMRRLRREGLEICRRRAGLAPTGVVAKKPSPPPPYYVLASPAPLPRPRPAPTTTSPPSSSPRSRHAAAPAEPAEVITSKCIGKGAQVRVRTQVATARTGQPTLRAVVDSAADDDGYLHVTYSYIDGKLPRTARVAPSDIRLHDAAPADARGAAASTGSSSAVTTDRSAPLSQQDEAAPRPTVAGKKLPLLKKFEKEMKTRSKAIKGCW
ncbi:LOW QUALITY PROTEIN: hypothetical protein GQ55_2G376500 [Panicum hallii var. hallii]|uniref:Uncharacterized protein n=1 Tax=Panicum hallii var. hallii TaxID=1504633 RepID=A0A2T7EWL7_9POAL|nr:LOW QUALITY PROTEIN: hypothetical protein GQ55_2G376500 [Panicum hallii var. hallii]